MKRVLKMLAALSIVGVVAGCATTIDYPYYHYRGYMGPDGIDYRYSNHH